MFYATVLIGKDTGGHSCIQVLPPQMNDQELGTKAEVIQCTGLANGGGYSMVRIIDPEMHLLDNFREETDGKNELGKYTVNRISNSQYIAMVINSNCQVAKIISECGCFITSASRITGGVISWTVVGMNSKSISDFVSRMEENGFPVKRTASYLPDRTPTLTEQALKLAFQNGYYEIPRKTTIHDMCQTSDISPAAFNITLRAAERKVLSYYLSNNRDSTKSKKKKRGGPADPPGLLSNPIQSIADCLDTLKFGPYRDIASGAHQEAGIAACFHKFFSCPADVVGGPCKDCP